MSLLWKGGGAVVSIRE